MKKIFRVLLIVFVMTMIVFGIENDLEKSDVNASFITPVSGTNQTKVQEDSYPERMTQDVKMDLVRTSKIPLFIQTDDEWKDLPYGTDADKSMAKNGCALATLAMVGNYYGFESTPKTLLDWAQEYYYVDGAGTSWDIFEDFAELHQLGFLNLGNDMQAAIEELEQGHLVVISVKKGKFTDVGHIMLLTGYKEGRFSLNDPNDDDTKLHNYNWVEATDIQESGINFWSYY